MYSEQVRSKFNELADKASNPDIATLIRELGDLMAARFEHTTGVHNEIYSLIKELHKEFVELSVLVIERLKDNEAHHATKIETITDKLHNLSNRFMGVENKTDEFFAYVDVQMAEVLAAVIGKVNE